MQKQSAKQLALGWTGMTVGFALMLPGLSWFTPIGMLVCFGSSFITRTEAQAARELWRLYLMAALAIAMVTIYVTDGRGLAVPKDGPSTWYVITLVITWAACAVWDYRRWKTNSSDETHAP